MTISRRSIKDDKPSQRWLIAHPESAALFECFSSRERQQHLNQGCEDVTHINTWEMAFQNGTYPGEKNINKVSEWQDVEAPLHLKYRPSKLGEVIGQKEVVKSLEGALKSKTRPHSFIFTGPSGCGKTTLARIIAKEFGCSTNNILETDAATNNGIDNVREIISTLRYQGFGEHPNKMIILDEAHALSKAAWQSFLKSVEEPPPHIFFAFCTTEDGKIPDTIRTRCQSYNLKSVKHDDLMDLLEKVSKQEKLEVEEYALGMVARACQGSPRQALVMLSTIKDCQDKDEISRLLELPLEDKEIIDLCRLLVNGNTKDLPWSEITKTLKLLKDQNAESIRIVIVNYLNSCLLNARSEKEVPKLLDLLNSFSKPCNSTDKLAPIMLAIGNHLFPG